MIPWVLRKHQKRLRVSRLLADCLRTIAHGTELIVAESALCEKVQIRLVDPIRGVTIRSMTYGLFVVLVERGSNAFRTEMMLMVSTNLVRIWLMMPKVFRLTLLVIPLRELVRIAMVRMEVLQMDRVQLVMVLILLEMVRVSTFMVTLIGPWMDKVPTVQMVISVEISLKLAL